MSVDPNIDYHSHDPEDGEQPAEDPRIREAEEIEARMAEVRARHEKAGRRTAKEKIPW